MAGQTCSTRAIPFPTPSMRRTPSTSAHNFGLLVDGSGHFKGSTTPPNLQNGSNDSTGVGYALGGVQYKWHSEKLSPFLRGMVGGASISPDCCHGNEWSFAAGGG